AALDLGLLQLAAALDVALVRAVHQDVRDRRVLEQDLQRAEPERLVEHLLDQLLALDAVEERVLGVAQVLDDAADVAPHGVAGQVADAGEVEPLDELRVDLPLQLVEVLAVAGAADRARAREAGNPARAGVAVEAVELGDS